MNYWVDKHNKRVQLMLSIPDYCNSPVELTNSEDHRFTLKSDSHMFYNMVCNLKTGAMPEDTRCMSLDVYKDGSLVESWGFLHLPCITFKSMSREHTAELGLRVDDQTARFIKSKHFAL